MVDFSEENKLITKLWPNDSLLELRGSSASWIKRYINSPSNSMTLICQDPGEGNRRHYHRDWDEWWFIIKGKWLFEIEGEEYEINTGDLVFIERNKIHKITCIGDIPAIRMAVSRADVDHIYVE